MYKEKYLKYKKKYLDLKNSSLNIQTGGTYVKQGTIIIGGVKKDVYIDTNDTKGEKQYFYFDDERHIIPIIKKNVHLICFDGSVSSTSKYPGAIGPRIYSTGPSTMARTSVYGISPTSKVPSSMPSSARAPAVATPIVTHLSYHREPMPKATAPPPSPPRGIPHTKHIESGTSIGTTSSVRAPLYGDGFFGISDTYGISPSFTAPKATAPPPSPPLSPSLPYDVPAVKASIPGVSATGAPMFGALIDSGPTHGLIDVMPAKGIHDARHPESGTDENIKRIDDLIKHLIRIRTLPYEKEPEYIKSTYSQSDRGYTFGLGCETGRNRVEYQDESIADITIRRWGTLGMGTCFIYSFLFCVSPTFRQLSVKNKTVIGADFRKYIALIDDIVDHVRNFMEMYDSENKLLGQERSVKGVLKTHIGDIGSYIYDSTATAIASYFGFDVLYFDYSHEKLPRLVPADRDCKLIAIQNKKNSVVLIRSANFNGSAHYESLSLTNPDKFVLSWDDKALCILKYDFDERINRCNEIQPESALKTWEYPTC